MTPFVLSQLLISVAIVSDIISFQFKEKRHILSCLIVSCTMISLHFLCLGHHTAALLGLVVACRFIVCIFTSKLRVMLFFIGISLLVTYFSYQGFLSILGCTGAIFGTIASFSKEDKRLRQIMMIGTSCWLVHNYLAGSPGAVIMEILFLSSNLVGYYRYYIRPKARILG